MPIYEKADQATLNLLGRAVALYHPAFRDADVTIDVLMAKASERQTSAPVKLHGTPVVAVIRTVPYKQRVLGQGDLEITIDQEQWEETSQDTRIAILDHQLCYRELKTDEDGNVKRDDLDRPKFKNIPDDFTCNWFAHLAQRHGLNSIEVLQARQMIQSERWQQSIQQFLPVAVVVSSGLNTGQAEQHSAPRRRRLRAADEL